ncbi:uncharacterized protein si:ch73-100l22.3 isoform X2 [Anabas testudineus]|uniref:uncharacterized protein si:ch73-100l22.3 isoform X2 n=1 Tax=Anabas testudineus TaxID=64144 RepID=UPI000E456951|nr:uncharacterized protein si:ch73-100l22.3 isoform X2 [Anabas testudineus]
MEDYDTFVQHRLSQLRKSEEEEHNKASTASSLICFYGRPILPPLLSGEQREEMQHHRDAAQKAAGHRRLKDDPRMAYVQTMLHSVQLRKTPTLEELLQETKINTESLSTHNTCDRAESQINYFVGTMNSASLSPPSVRNQKDGVPLPPMTSTTYSAFFTCNVTPQQSYHKGCLIDQRDSQQGPEPSLLIGASHQSVSSGYITHENVENTISVSGRLELGSGSHAFGSSEGVYNMGAFFLHNTSNTVSKMPDIINYPPIDGEELERSGQESSFSNNFICTKDICCTFQENSVTCDHVPEEQSEKYHLDVAEGDENPPFSTIVDLDKEHSFDRVGVPEVSENSPEISQTVSTHHCPKTALHIQPDPKETEPTDETEPSEEPYRLSLQALLKKSQEYRRRQRMLRNQAKNTKIQERSQEQPRARAEEQSLSDKENDEFPYKGTVTAGGKRTKDGRGFFIPTMEMSKAKKSWENERMMESEFVGKNKNINSESRNSPGDGKLKEMHSVEEDAVYKNNKLNSSQEVISEPKEIGALLQQQPMSTDTSQVQQAFYLTTCPTALYKGVGKYHTIPVPNLCKSPVHCKSRGSSKDGKASDGTKDVAGNTNLNEDHKTNIESILEHPNIDTALASPVSVVVEHDVPVGTDLARSSQHIDQLESGLSSLKVLISDLESTVKENLENRGQTESNTQSECSFKAIKHSEKIESDLHLQLGDDCFDNKLGDVDKVEYREWPCRQSFDNSHNMHEDTRSEPRFSDTDDVLLAQGKGTERVNISELGVVKPITAERRKEKGTGKEGLTKTSNCRKQQTSAKCFLSMAQRMRIPDIFRNVPPESTVPSNVSVLSDTSNHPVDRRNETVGKGHDSTHSPSLNQSYDVDTPSDLWLIDESGSDLGSKVRPTQEKHLTPESGGEGQGGVSKVKRRLLMYGTEEAQDRSPDIRAGAGSVVRPNSSTPRAAVIVNGGNGSQKDVQEQLKQVHAAQIRALQDEHRRQQEELLQRERAG